MSFWSERCFIVASWLSQHLSVKKTKNEKNKALEIVLQQTQLRSKAFLIRPKCARSRVWSNFSDQIDLWLDHLQTVVQTVVRSNCRPYPVISVWEHTGVRSIGSVQKAIWVWNSNWEIDLLPGWQKKMCLLHRPISIHTLQNCLTSKHCWPTSEHTDGLTHQHNHGHNSVSSSVANHKQLYHQLKQINGSFQFCPSPQCFYATPPPQLQIICCYIACYYVKNSMCTWGA